jgi:ubiquinone/menaquinone biosynthesis C-methylase UbiE
MIREQEAFLYANRFSNRAANYLKYRPAWQPQVLAFMQQSMGLKRSHSIADIGSGTGRFAKLLLQNGYGVTGVEPNDDMRETAEKDLACFENFTSMAGSGEDTGLQSNSVDLVVVAHAFHWMDTDAAREEFQRILRPGGKIVLAWTIRQTNSDFLRGYDQIKKKFRSHQAPPLIDEEKISSFYGPGIVQQISFLHNSWVNFESLKGLLLSSSGIPLPAHPQYDSMISSLVRLFVAHNQNGFVNLSYETRLYW